MRKIAAALAAYVSEKGGFPPRAIRDEEGTPILSWRVALLPYLGHTELYNKFRKNLSWNRPENRAFLSEIPPVFQYPGRADARTNYLLVTAENTVFSASARESAPLESIKDGVGETAIMVEVDDEFAVEWTSPADFEFSNEDVTRGLQLQQNDGFLLAWADGSVSLWPRSAQQSLIRGLFSIAGGEPPARSLSTAAYVARSQESSAAPDAMNGNQGIMNQPAGVQTGQAAANMPLGTSVAPDGLTVVRSQPELSTDIRREPPSEEQLAQASSIVRDLYDQEFKNAKLDKDKRDFAKKLLEDVARIEADSAGRFVLMRAARDIAAKAGDVTVAIDACDRLGREFRVDLLSMKLKALEQAVVNLAAESELAPLYTNSLQLGDEALQLDDFKSAQTLYRLAMNAARRGRSAEREYQINLREGDLRETRVAYQRITDHVHTLVRAPEDPAANAAVGRYYLLLKRDWDRGLPMVLRGDNAPLKKIAESDLARPTEAEAMVAVGDQWWDFAEKLSVDTEKTSARIRARHWYEAAQPNLGASLQKIRVEKRIAEIKREQDKAEGKQSLGAAAGGRS